MSWIRNNYQPKINRKQNNLNFSNMLRSLREQHFKSLLEKLKQSGLGGLSGRGYIIQEVTPHKFCTLQNYNLFNLQTSEIVIGSYDTMCEYIDGLVQDKQKTEAN